MNIYTAPRTLSNGALCYQSPKHVRVQCRLQLCVPHLKFGSHDRLPCDLDEARQVSHLPWLLARRRNSARGGCCCNDHNAATPPQRSWRQLLGHCCLCLDLHGPGRVAGVREGRADALVGLCLHMVISIAWRMGADRAVLCPAPSQSLRTCTRSYSPLTPVLSPSNLG